MKEINLQINWQVVRMIDVANKITDGTHKTPSYKANGIPFITTVNLVPFGENFTFSKYEKFISKEEHLELTRRTKPEKGDLLISKCGTIGRAQIVRVDYDFSIFVGLMLIKLKQDKVNPKFVEYFINQDVIQKKLASLSTGATRATLPINKLCEFNIPLPFKNNHPDLDEQKRIANKIDNLFSEINKGIVQMKIALDSAEKLWQSELEKLFGNECPNNWIHMRLGDFVDIKGGKRMPKGQKFSDRPTNYRYIRVSDMDNMSVDEKGIKYISRDIYNFLKSYAISKDALYVSIAGTIGKVGEVPDALDNSILTENAVRLNFDNKKFNKRYLCIVLNSFFAQKQIVMLIKKMGQPKLAIFRAKEIMIPTPFKNNMPDVEEQMKVTIRLNEIQEQVKQLEEKYKEQLDDFNKLKQSILNQAFQGKL